MSDRLAIGIDVGGTGIKGGLVDGALKVRTHSSFPTDATRGPDAIVDDISNLIDRLSVNGDVTAIGVGTPGPLSPSRGVVFKSVNLPGWRNVALRERLAERTGRPVVIDNDANVAAFGEFQADPETRDLVLLTLGTGVGAGTVLDGKIFHGRHENASEWGHMILEPEGVPCKCGQRGCLETVASASAVALRVEQAIEAGEPSSLAEHHRAGKPISAEMVVFAAKAGDTLCQRAWDEACRALAIACINIQHALNPECVLLGGGMSAAGGFLLQPVNRHFSEMHWRLHQDAPRIALARLGNMAGVIGAAALALEQ